MATESHEPVTIERLERGLALCAYLVALDGPRSGAAVRESGA